MGHATTILRLRDADRETEITLEALDGDAEDGAVLELAIVQPYNARDAQQTRGYVRLPRRYFDMLAEWIGNHHDHLRSVEWAEENAPGEDEEFREEHAAEGEDDV